jgi:hypothetical protein
LRLYDSHDARRLRVFNLRQQHAGLLQLLKLCREHGEFSLQAAISEFSGDAVLFR